MTTTPATARARTLAKTALQALCLALLVVSTACSSIEEPAPSGADLSQQETQYAAEPYPILIVDRRKFDRRFLPATVRSPVDEPPGTILVDTQNRYLYLIGTARTARRYGVAVGASGHAWTGTASIGRMATWPAWHPTDDMRAQTADLPRRIGPGSHNPLGARALYLYAGGRDTLYRIHGTSEPWTIGTEASSGCIRMLNEDIIELYALVEQGAKVIVR